MSWFARSIANTFSGEGSPEPEDTAETGEREPSSGVKEDLSELTKTFTRQLWGVASFLAPPPTPTAVDSAASDHPKPSSPVFRGKEAEDEPVSPSGGSPRLTGIRHDLSEIGGRFKSGISGISKLASGNKAVTEISRLATSFLPFGDEEEEEEEEEEEKGVVGVTEEVLTFARNISMHPETWLDFSLVADDEDDDDFEMSEAQQAHALAVERLAPRLAALRIELCPGHMSEGCFWKIYFVLLHSLLNKHDAALLSTPQIDDARRMLHELNLKKTESRMSEREPIHPPETAMKVISQDSDFGSSYRTVPLEPANLGTESVEISAVKNSDIGVVDKSVIEETSTIQNKNVLTQTLRVSSPEFEEDEDDWLDEGAEISGHGHISVPLVNEEDVSFSDLEEEDDTNIPMSSRGKDASDNSSIDGSRGWVQLSESPSDDAAEENQSTASSHPSDVKTSRRKSDNNGGKRDSRESNDWLSVDDIDVV